MLCCFKIHITENLRKNTKLLGDFPPFPETMNRFLLLSALIIVCGALPRTPRIYNVLISTKKNLSPSHALPVYEPVLRTTSLGLAFPSLYYNTPQVQVIQSANVQPLVIFNEKSHFHPFYEQFDMVFREFLAESSVRTKQVVRRYRNPSDLPTNNCRRTQRGNLLVMR